MDIDFTIDMLKKYINSFKIWNIDSFKVTPQFSETLKSSLKIIEIQQKEIEDLKEITQNYNAIGGETFGDDRIIVCSMKYFDDGYFKKNYITKDKIREKIGEIKAKTIGASTGIYATQIDILEELLEEK